MLLRAIVTILALADAPPNLAEADRLYPDADAVILSWSQTFTAREDGTVALNADRIGRGFRLVGRGDPGLLREAPDGTQGTGNRTPCGGAANSGMVSCGQSLRTPARARRLDRGPDLPARRSGRI